MSIFADLKISETPKVQSVTLQLNPTNSNVPQPISNVSLQLKPVDSIPSQPQPISSITLNIVTPKPKLNIPATSNEPRHVELDILPKCEEATIPLVLPPAIPTNKQDDGDILILVLNRKEHSRICGHMVSYHRALHKSREKCETGEINKKKHLPDVVLTRIVKEVKSSQVKNIGSLLQAVASYEI